MTVKIAIKAVYRDLLKISPPSMVKPGMMEMEMEMEMETEMQTHLSLSLTVP